MILWNELSTQLIWLFMWVVTVRNYWIYPQYQISLYNKYSNNMYLEPNWPLLLWTETIPYLPMLEEKLKIKKKTKKIKSKKQIKTDSNWKIKKQKKIIKSQSEKNQKIIKTKTNPGFLAMFWIFRKQPRIWCFLMFFWFFSRVFCDFWISMISTKKNQKNNKK